MILALFWLPYCLDEEKRFIYRSGMDTGFEISLLRKRRQTIVGLIQSLQAELAHLDKALNVDGDRAPVLFNREYFWRNIFPILWRSHPKGMTTAEIRGELRRQNLQVSDGRFRTFLTRLGQDGILNRTERTVGHSRWVLSDQALKSRDEKF